MKRLIIAGNGFDLAHNLKTSYKDFLIWYLTNCIHYARVNREYNDLLIGVRLRFHSADPLAHHGATVDMVNFFYQEGLGEALLQDSFGSKGSPEYKLNPFIVEIKSVLLQKLLQKCNHANWVDIENEFYFQLRTILGLSGLHKEELLNKLNKSLAFIIEQLGAYLSSLPEPEPIAGYSEIIQSVINNDDILSHVQQHQQPPEETMVLNFNYTDTISQYLPERSPHSKPVQVNFIHGRLNDDNNPLIFGFGDELDDNYAKMERQQVRGYFEYIKSFWYFKTSNYHNLVRFIESDTYQVYILGHSCGLSDRTMLNMVFEHSNCQSIKIYYHQHQHGNNFTPLTQEISRHFRNKTEMRRKIVPFDRSSAMPQKK